MSVGGRVMALLNAYNGYQSRDLISLRGIDPATAEVIAEMIEASAQPCDYLAHEAGCLQCGIARYAKDLTAEVRRMGGLR